MSYDLFSLTSECHLLSPEPLSLGYDLFSLTSEYHLLSPEPLNMGYDIFSLTSATEFGFEYVLFSHLSHLTILASTSTSLKMNIVKPQNLEARDLPLFYEIVQS